MILIPIINNLIYISIKTLYGLFLHLYLMKLHEGQRDYKKHELTVAEEWMLKQLSNICILQRVYIFLAFVHDKRLYMSHLDYR
jgi:hypothetical protein